MYGTIIKQDFYRIGFDRKITRHHIKGILHLLLRHHVNPAHWSPGGGLGGHSIVLFGHRPALGSMYLWCWGPPVSIHFLVEEVGNPLLDVGGFHNRNTT